MLELMLLRHATAVPHQGGPDFMRPLSIQGMGEAHLMAEELRRQGMLPDVIITSGALRTEQTGACFLGFPDHQVIHVKDLRLYEAARNAYFDVARDVVRLGLAKEATKRIMVVGHNPSIGNFLNALLADDEVAQVPRSHSLDGAHKGGALNFAPATCTLLLCAIESWDALAPCCARVKFWLPVNALSARAAG